MPASRSCRKVGPGEAPALATVAAPAIAARSAAGSHERRVIPSAWQKRLDLSLHGQPLERLRLDLADALPRHAKRAADLLERLRVGIAVEPVAELEDVALALGEILERAVQRLLLEADVHLLLGRLLRGRDQLAEPRALVLADGLVEARDRPRRLAHLAQLLEGQLRGP